MNKNQEQTTKLVKISVVAEYFGVSQQTVRRWEEKGIISSIRMDKNSYRLYDIEKIKKLKNIE